MRPHLRRCLFAIGLYSAAGLAGPAMAGGDAEESLVEAIADTKPYIDARYRFEHVDQDGFTKNANASTLRTRLGLQTGEFHGVSILAEAENIAHLGSARFNSTNNARTQYPTVADSRATEVNQLYGQYTGLANHTFRFGRQRVILDNARFVGNVGFRQNEQTYDSFAVINTSLPDTTAVYGYVWNVNRIFGDRSDVGNFGTSTHLLNASYGGFDLVTPTAFAYLIDLTDTGLGESSIATYGLRLSGKTEIADGFKALYTAEFAHQNDYASATIGKSLDYYTAEVGIAAAKLAGEFDVTVKLGYEVLEGDGTNGFQTPLATLHAFNGWADKFLATPSGGIEDAYVKLGVKAYGVNFLAAYHDFGAERGGLDHGSEWNLRIARKFYDHLTLAVKYANYDADNTSTDTEKIWLTAGVKF